MKQNHLSQITMQGGKFTSKIYIHSLSEATVGMRNWSAQQHDSYRAFATTSDCFPSKATKDPRFRGGKPTVFQRKTAKINQSLGKLGLGKN